MPQQKGATTKVAMGFEATYGTAPATGYLLDVNSCNVVGSKARNTPATIDGTRNPSKPFSGNVDVSGPTVIPADSICLAYWLAAMFGDPVSTGSGPYVHEYKIANTMPSFTLEKHYTDLTTDKYERFTGCKIASFGITVGGDGELTIDMQILGATPSFENSAFDASATDITLARLDNLHAAITEGGSALSNGRELSINVDFGLDPDARVIGSGGVRGSIPEGDVSITGTLTTLFEDSTLLDKALADTESSLKLTITGSANSIFELEIQELQYDVSGISLDGPTGMVVPMSFNGYYVDGTEASAIVARLTNSVASYDLVP